MADRRRYVINLSDKLNAASLIVGLVIAACLTYSVFVRNDAVYAEQIKAVKCKMGTIVKNYEQQQRIVNVLVVGQAKQSESNKASTEALAQVAEAIKDQTRIGQRNSLNMSISLARVDERLGSVEQKLDINKKGIN